MKLIDIIFLLLGGMAIGMVSCFTLKKYIGIFIKKNKKK